MCLSCGCGEPNERHGDERHITQEDVEAAAKAAETSPRQAAQNILDGLSQSQTGSSS
jgi:hypothetical protein